MKMFISMLLFSSIVISCKSKNESELSFDDYTAASNANLWLDYSKEATTFKIWSPTADAVRVNLYKTGHQDDLYAQHNLSESHDGVWSISVDGDLHETYYTYQVNIEGSWLEETPGIYAQAVGVNGKRAMVLDFETTNPEQWQQDKGPDVKSPNEAIIYELHVRDMTIHPESGSSFPGKYLGLTEQGTKGPNGVATAIDHLKELGITHVHLLPSYDHYSIDERKLDTPQFNWGYDPQNYNVPEGSFSSDPYNAAVRIMEFKEMVKTFHDNGIGVILDVVYNHTGVYENSNFNLENPEYYYRQWEDGKLSDAAACGNETASERAMMRKFILESTKYWAKEYHLDGFRFDLMGIHDIETMNTLTENLKRINPNMIIYGEGWTAADSPLKEEQRALKKYTYRMPQLSAFSDDIRDGLKGSVFDDASTGFVSGAKDTEESIKFGVVGSIAHPQIDYEKVNYSDEPWAKEPWQAISYVSCHDNHTIYDKLQVSRRDASEADRIAMNKLAQAIVFTSQGTAFMHAGAEFLRTKNEEHNSYKSPDTINQINWNLKSQNASVFEYYKNIIHLRKEHPAFRMHTAKEVQENLSFKTQEPGLISYQISNNANGDLWKSIYVIYNARTEAVSYSIPGTWYIAIDGEVFNWEEKRPITNNISVPPISMVILYQE